MLATLRTTAAYVLAATMTLAAPAQAADAGRRPAYHIFPTPGELARTGHIARPTSGDMEYFGGSVFSSVKVVSVIWGRNVDPQTVANIGGFLGALANSTYVDQMSIYNTNLKAVNGRKGTRQTIGRGSFIGQVQITPQHASRHLKDKAVRDELTYQISQGVLPANDPNTLYMIYFPASVSITIDGLRSCQAFGAYHEAASAKVSASNIFYGVMPDCGGGFDYLTVASSHEFAEATTDNIPTPGSNPKYPQAWNTSDGYEIADLCEGIDATLAAGSNSYLVQELYLNNKATCGTANFNSP